MKAVNLLCCVDAVRACRSGADLFDTELIIRAEHSGLAIAEIPVTVTELRPSRTSIARRVPAPWWGSRSCGCGSAARRVPSAVLAGADRSLARARGRCGRRPGDRRHRPWAPQWSATSSSPPASSTSRSTGLGDVDFWTADPDGWLRAGRRLLASGVTSYLPTLVSAPLDGYDAALDRVAAGGAPRRRRRAPPHRGRAPRGSVPRRRAGRAPARAAAAGRPPVAARPARRAPGSRAPRDARARSRSRARAAPACSPAAASSSRSATHAAPTSTPTAAADAGATMVTHLFNGMEPLATARRGSPVPRSTDDRLTPTLIADLVHVHPAVLRPRGAGRSRACS